MGTLPISPTMYQIKTGDKYNQLIGRPTWCNPDAMPKGYSTFFSYQLKNNSYAVGFNPEKKAVDTYILEGASQGLSKKTSDTLDLPYSSLSIAPFNEQQYIMGYDPNSGTFDFYLLKEDLSLEKTYSYSGSKDLTTTSMFTYRGALYFMGYDMDNGAVAYYQITANESGNITSKEIWTDKWAQGWTRFTFFQMAMENFFFKTNIKYDDCNIDHIMDDPANGSHPVGTHLPLSQDLDIVQSFYFKGDVYFTTYRAKDGTMTLNKFLDNGQGWTEEANYTTFTDGVCIVPIYTDEDSFLLVY